MAYCTTADVTQRFKSLTVSSSGTAIVTSQLEGFIDQYSALIDARIAKRYETPVSSAPYALLILKLICLYFVVAEVERIVGVEATREANERQDSFRAMAERLLAGIESGQTELTDATAVSAGSIRSGNVSNSVTATFERGKRQW